MSVEFLITAFIVVLLPGTGVIYTVSIGLFRGTTFSLWAALGCTFGIVPHMLASILGLAALMHTSALAFQTVKYAGVVYLLYLAYGMWKEKGTLSVKQVDQHRNGARVAFHGTLINVLNPKLSIFFLAFLPQFITTQSQTPLLDMGILSLTFMGMTFVVFAIYGCAAAWMRRYVMENERLLGWLQRSFAAAFVALGVKLAFEER
ncbi:LysE family translocator [Terasakiella sp.]|uniref:LysE family translocator n=1 Tax=Terasakiella sp. TaxID=2034861 RepID=UPI003AA8F411